MERRTWLDTPFERVQLNLTIHQVHVYQRLIDGRVHPVLAETFLRYSRTLIDQILDNYHARNLPEMDRIYAELRHLFDSSLTVLNNRN